MSAPFMASGCGGGRAQCGQAQNQPLEFEFFVVIDFEATCEKGARIYPQEIIEFPSVLVDAATGRLESVFRRDLTGIQQADVDGSVDLGEALRLHDAWLEAAMAGRPWAKKCGRFAVVTWGDWDCRTVLESECRFKGIAKPPYFDRWINLRVPFEAAFGGGGRINLQDAVKKAGLEWEGRLHCGLDDARNTARLLLAVMRLGVKICITGSLVPPPQQQQKPKVSLCNGAAGACLCLCGVASRGGMMAVPGPMQGKCFMGCGNWTPGMGAMCPYFVWCGF